MTTISFLALIILSLAVYRLTHLIVFDKIFEPIRNLFVIRDFYYMEFWLQGGTFRRAIGMIMICPWCSSLWVSFILTIAYYQQLSIFIFLQVLAYSAVASLIETAWMKFVGFPEMKPGTQKEENKNV
jgi:hypothetical protein